MGYALFGVAYFSDVSDYFANLDQGICSRWIARGLLRLIFLFLPLAPPFLFLSPF